MKRKPDWRTRSDQPDLREPPVKLPRLALPSLALLCGYCPDITVQVEENKQVEDVPSDFNWYQFWREPLPSVDLDLILRPTEPMLVE